MMVAMMVDSTAQIKADMTAEMSGCRKGTRMAEKLMAAPWVVQKGVSLAAQMAVWTVPTMAVQTVIVSVD